MTTFDWIGVLSLVACVALVAFAAGANYQSGVERRRKRWAAREAFKRPYPPGHPEDWTPEEAREHYPRFRAER